MNWEDCLFDSWIKDNLPKDKESFSRDFVEYLLKQAYKEGHKRQIALNKIQEREDSYGPDYI